MNPSETLEQYYRERVFNSLNLNIAFLKLIHILKTHILKINKICDPNINIMI